MTNQRKQLDESFNIKRKKGGFYFW
jgi:hypothetical protein